MERRLKILKIVYGVVSEINKERTEENQIELLENSVLYGREGKLDSLGLVNLIVAIEQNVVDELRVTISLSDEKALSQKNSPFRTIASLTDYIQKIM